MKSRILSFALIAAIAMVGVVGQAAGVPQEEETFGDKVKKFFEHSTPKLRKRKPKKKTTPTPAPTPKRRAKHSPSASPSASPGASVSPAAEAQPTSSPSETPPAKSSVEPEPSRTPRVSATAAPSHSRLSEPVRAIEPGPHRKRTKTPPSEEETPSPRKKRSPAATVTPEATEAASATPSPTATVSDSPKSRGSRSPIATISTNEIVGYQNYPPNVRKMLDRALSLTTQNLGYKYGSADPANGGMDCSGFIHYVLSQSGMKEVPRDAREQYIWLRKAGTFQAVLAHRDDTFELDALKPGDLLFWTGTYSVARDPDITHTMIYVGREQGTNQRIMVGASDGRSYKGQSRFGVSVFDFKVTRLASQTGNSPGPTFIGYGPVPGLPEN
jgi:cell wall-associated NlpC family hydrolase